MIKSKTNRPTDYRPSGTSNEAINPKTHLGLKISVMIGYKTSIMNDSNMSTQYLNQADEFSNQYKKK